MSPFLHRCQCMRGFFVLRACDATAPHSCPHCSRPVCAEHWSVVASPPACHECVARMDERRSIDDDDFDARWFHHYRHRYYTDHYYRPIYTGRSIGAYYDIYDAQAFDPAAAGNPDAAGGGTGDAVEDDDRPGGLGDS